MYITKWEGNRQEGQGSSDRGNRLQVSDIFLSLLIRRRKQTSVIFFPLLYTDLRDLPGGSDGKTSAFNVGALGSIPGLGRSSGEGNVNPLQYSCLENPMDGEVW